MCFDVYTVLMYPDVYVCVCAHKHFDHFRLFQDTSHG